MSDAITPALSAEEWGKPYTQYEACEYYEAHGERLFNWDDGVQVAQTDGNSLAVNWDGAVYDEEMQPVTTSRHALAALALHGQPFGFAREDVEFLARVIDGDYDGMGLDYWVGKAASVKLDSIRVRIAALLPPA